MHAGLSLVVTFATSAFAGNPAYVVTDPGTASDATLQGFCAVLGTGVIAVIDGLGEAAPGLRFFTPGGSHPGAGHATMAAAHVALRGTTKRSQVSFRLGNGETRHARTDGDRIAIGFPVMPAERVDRVDEIAASLAARPAETWVSAFGYVAYFRQAEAISGLRPDMALLEKLDRNAVIATAPGAHGADIVIRVFAPKVGLPEDPVCGTAHRIIIPYWAERLGKAKLSSRHLSPRGGDLWCANAGNEVVIAGQTCLVYSGIVDIAEA